MEASIIYTLLKSAIPFKQSPVFFYVVSQFWQPLVKGSNTECSFIPQMAGTCFAFLDAVRAFVNP